MAKIKIFKGQNGEGYFHVVMPDDSIALTSEGYSGGEWGTIRGINSFVKNLREHKRDLFEVFYSERDNKWYFHAKAKNGEIIGRSAKGYNEVSEIAVLLDNLIENVCTYDTTFENLEIVPIIRDSEF